MRDAMDVMNEFMNRLENDDFSLIKEKFDFKNYKKGTFTLKELTTMTIVRESIEALKEEKEFLTDEEYIIALKNEVDGRINLLEIGKY